MSPNKAIRTEAEPTSIDRILAADDQLVPSSGFLATVMERVREEAAAPPPIPFPWKRTVPGLVFVTCALGWILFKLVQQGLPTVSSLPLTIPHLSVAAERLLEQAGWVALALGASLLSWLLSRRLAGRSGLL
jgi:hypothetical protein